MIIPDNVRKLAIFINIACKDKLKIFVGSIRLKEPFTNTSSSSKEVKKGYWLFPFKKRFLFCHINKRKSPNRLTGGRTFCGYEEIP